MRRYWGSLLMSLHFDPPFLPLHTALLAVLAAGAVLMLYLRRELRSQSSQSLLLAGLRIGLVLALALILLNPVVVSSETPKGKRPFLLMLDTSRSMNTNDVEGGSRYAAARKATLENDALMAALTERYDLRVFGFSERPEVSRSEALQKLQRPNGNRTNIGAALVGAAKTLGGKQSGGGEILLVSDGRDTCDSFPLEVARALRAGGFTLSTLCIGRQTRRRDLQVVARKTQVFASPGQEVQLAAEVVSSGLPRTHTRVELMRDGRPVMARDVVVEPGRTEVDFPVRHSSKGLYRYAIRVASAPEEPNTANNRVHIFLNVSNDRVRVLFLEGRPSWDSKFLAQALRSNPTVTVDVIYKLTDTRFFAVIGGGEKEKEEGIAIPRTPEQMSRYDVIIFGKGFEEFYDQAGATALKEWIATRGGNVVFLRGRSDERTAALREIEPVAWSDQELEELQMRLTEEGRTHPSFAFPVSEDAQTVVKRLPPLVSATRVQGEKALAVVLARADDADGDRDVREMATLAYQRYGQGKVMAIVGQGLWRWAMLPPELEGYHKVYQEFWTQTVRWMVSESDFLPGQNLALKTDRTSYSPGETVHFRGYIRSSKSASPPTLSVFLPNGKMARLASARGDGKQADFTATFRPTLLGEYVVAIESASGKAVPVAAHFTVNSGLEEDLNRSADPDLMRQLAVIGGGHAYSLHDIGDLPQQLKAAELARERKTDPRTAWDRPWVLMALMVLLGAEWWLRRKSGLA
ncbi:MAG TPA: VWA domain-containing protein [Chthonomonadales bacterium]|nr:VWA domain-containing protein [Chthonomonadales bacterium]